VNAAQILILPGWQNSGPTHWQSLWQQKFGYTWVEQHDWMRPLRGDWVARLEDVVLSVDAPVVLVAHSLGCHLVAAWAAHFASQHAGQGRSCWWHRVMPSVKSYAPCWPSWSPPVLQSLPFRSCLVASTNDPYCSFERACEFANAWGADLVNLGALGHINADSGLGDWPQGQALLQALITL
jgi:predicted alpha/beta hydrolase family esterase